MNFKKKKMNHTSRKMIYPNNFIILDQIEKNKPFYIKIIGTKYFED